MYLVYIIFACVILMMAVLIYSNMERESFQSETNIDIGPDYQLRQMVKDISIKKGSSESEYVKKTGVEQAARALARDYCPVPPNFDITQYVKKTEIKEKQCPPMPDMKDFVLKSSIPPVQQCPPCVCPKISVEGGLEKKCPEPNFQCPPPKPCGFEECKNVIKCRDNETMVPPCPECPPPAPCPKEPVKVCPAVKLPSKKDLECPPCKYYGMKQVDKDIMFKLQDLIDNNDMEKLKEIKDKVNELDIADPEELQKTIDQLREKLKKQNNKPSLDITNKMDSMLKEIQQLKENRERLEKDSDEKIKLTNETTIAPSSEEDTCRSLPLDIDSFEDYNLIGSSI